MTDSLEQRALAATFAFLDRHWRWVVVAMWAGFLAYGLIERWSEIQSFNLRDTDDNLRMMQVRALLGGQDWYDLRQYRLNPPFGLNIHWSHLVDLPIAGLILALRPLIGGAEAERWAAAIAPTLPLLLLLFSVALTARRLVDKRAYPLAFIALFFAASTQGMFWPMRIDHHGWQLALLALAISGASDPSRRRGGLTLGLATALSLAIGLEMLIYFAVLGAATTFSWVADRDERARLATYSISLAGGTGLAFLLFASYDNRAAVCDALSPVWTADMALGGALLFGLAVLSPARWQARLTLAAIAGVALAGFHALAFPQCLTRLEGVSPEVTKLWLSHVREARPLYQHGARIALLVAALPVTGLIGWGFLAWLKRGDHELVRRIGTAALPCLAATLLLLWQSRTGPAAQLTALVGATALLWFAVPRTWTSNNAVVRIAGTFAIVMIAAGGAVPLISQFIAEPNKSAAQKKVSRANYLCNSLWAYRPVAKLPKGVVFTYIDFGPRIVTVTHHDSIAGPYHRNGDQIADVMNAFRGSVDDARRIIGKYRANYLLVCPDAATSTIFSSEAPGGFYDQLVRGKVPAWLKPINLGKELPFLMWQVEGQPA